jgi:phage terminase small subunit
MASKQVLDELYAGDPEDYGPAMQALEPQRQAFVNALLDQRGRPDLGQAAIAAGYSDHPGTCRVTGYHLARNPRIIAALQEESRRRFTIAGWMGVINLIKIAEDDTHKMHYKASVELADRFGYAAVTEHTVKVQHTDLTGQAILERIRALAVKHKIPEATLLGGNTIEATATELKE